MKIILLENRESIRKEVISIVLKMVDPDFLRVCYNNSDFADTVSVYRPDVILTSESNVIDDGVCFPSKMIRYSTDSVEQSLFTEISAMKSGKNHVS